MQRGNGHDRVHRYAGTAGARLQPAHATVQIRTTITTTREHGVRRKWGQGGAEAPRTAVRTARMRAEEQNRGTERRCGGVAPSGAGAGYAMRTQIVHVQPLMQRGLAAGVPCHRLTGFPAWPTEKNQRYKSSHTEHKKSPKRCRRAVRDAWSHCAGRVHTYTSRGKNATAIQRAVGRRSDQSQRRGERRSTATAATDWRWHTTPENKPPSPGAQARCQTRRQQS